MGESCLVGEWVIGEFSLNLNKGEIGPCGYIDVGYVFWNLTEYICLQTLVHRMGLVMMMETKMEVIDDMMLWGA